MQIAVSLLEERKTAELTTDSELTDILVGPSAPLLLLLVITANIWPPSCLFASHIRQKPRETKERRSESNYFLPYPAMI